LQPSWQLRFFAVTLSSALLFGAAGPAHSQDVSRSATKGPTGRIVADETGRRVMVPAEVKRIVTLAPDLTETIYALGLEELLAGDTEICDTPPAARAKPHVGTPVSPNLEAIVALHPDFVLASTSINREQTVNALQGLGIAVYTSDPHTVSGMLDSIAQIAELTGAGERGAAVVAQLRARLDALHARLADLPLVHVLFVVWEDPLITVGQNTFIADALRWAGAESVILSKQNWPRVGLEEVMRLQPEFIVLTGDHMKAEGNDSVDLQKRPGWKELRAVELGHVVVIGEGVDRPAPGLIDAIEELARVLHPDAFKLNSDLRKVKVEKNTRLHADATTAKERGLCAL
jgi:iron complex transport system substrate-binding protein